MYEVNIVIYSYNPIICFSSLPFGLRNFVANWVAVKKWKPPGRYEPCWRTASTSVGPLAVVTSTIFQRTLPQKDMNIWRKTWKYEELWTFWQVKGEKEKADKMGKNMKIDEGAGRYMKSFYKVALFMFKAHWVLMYLRRGCSTQTAIALAKHWTQKHLEDCFDFVQRYPGWTCWVIACWALID